MQNETEILDVHDTSMDDLRQLVDNIIHTPLNKTIEKHIDDIKWNIESTKEKVQDNISISNNTKKEFKKLYDENMDEFSFVKELIEERSKEVLGNINEKFNYIESDLKIYKENVIQLVKDSKESSKGFGVLKNVLDENLLHTDNRFNKIEIFLENQLENSVKKNQLMQKQLNESSEELKVFSSQIDNQCQKNRRLQIGIIILSIINLFLIVILIYILLAPILQP